MEEMRFSITAFVACVFGVCIPLMYLRRDQWLGGAVAVRRVGCRLRSVSFWFHVRSEVTQRQW